MVEDDQEIEQRTYDWYKQRLGKVTASQVYRVMSKARNGYNAYFYELLAEKVAPEEFSGDYFKSEVHSMIWGIEHEDEARERYAETTGSTVIKCGFVDHPSINGAGASPDGLVNDDGLIEIKCPSTETHLKTCHVGNISSQYMYQMQFQMACTGRLWCDFVSYDPRFKGRDPDWSMRIIRVDRDEVMIQDMEQKVCQFLRELHGAMKIITENVRVCEWGGDGKEI